MFAFAAVLLSAAAIAVTVLPHFLHSRTLLRAVLLANLLLCAVGAMCLFLSVSLTVDTRVLAAVVAEDAEFWEWAADMLSVWRYTCGFFSAVIGGIALLAALIRHPLRRVRSAVMAVSSVLAWILGGAYAVTCETPVVDLVTLVHLWTAGCALLLLAGSAVDAAWALRAAKKK